VDVHRGLGEAIATLGILVVESADIGTINQPVDGILGPLDGVGVERVMGGADADPSLTVIGCGIALSEVVGLNGVILSAHRFPVNLIQVIRLQKGGADNALARRSLHLNGQFAVEEVEVADNSRSISFLVDSELGTIGAGGDTAATDLELVESTTLGEVKVKAGLSGTLVGRAC